MSTPSSFTSIPIIDISGLFSDKFEDRQAVAAQLGSAARDVGFLMVSNHRVPTSVTDGIRDVAREYFAQPLDKKMESYIGKSKVHRGYVPEDARVERAQNGPRERQESYDIGFESDIVEGPLLGPNIWPENNPRFVECVKAYYSAVFQLGRTLSHGFAIALGLEEDYFDKLITCPPANLRMIHYPYDPSAEDAPGMGAHTDFQCFTILMADDPGLEVLNGDGVWIDAPPVPGAFVVNIGDMLETLTAGQFIATSHRVRRVQSERYSFPLFYACDYDVEFKPLPQFLSESKTQRKYTPLSGKHTWAQLIHSYKYLDDKVRRGELALPEGSVDWGSYGLIAKE